jgi:hypothetical protein
MELKGDAAQVAAALRSPQGRVKRENWDVLDHGMKRDPTWVITEGVRDPEQPCSGNQWQWQGDKFKMSPSREVRTHALKFENGNMWGDLVGTDHGEWSGELTWIPKQGAPEVLIKDNVHAVEYDTDGAIVIFGLGHMSFNYGYALKVSPSTDGSWTQTEVARLPGEPLGVTKLNSDRVAVLTSGGVVVFSSKEGILGVATCESR